MSKSHSFGTKLTVDGKVVGALKNINGVEISADTIDVTTLDNTDGYREKLAGLKDAGEVSASGLMDGEDAGQDKCAELLNSGEVVDCAIVFPAKIGKTWSFKACVTKFSTGAELEDAVSFEIALAVSGKPTLGITTEAASQTETTNEEG